MKKLMITGFQPFGGESINPSYEAVRRLPEEINGYKIESLSLPVVFGEAAEVAIAAAQRLCPDVIIAVGQAGGRSEITPEYVGINLRYADVPDNKGKSPRDEAIKEGGSPALFSTLPVRKMTEAISEAGLPARISYSAGAYVCNDLYYSLLSHFCGTATRVCFIHVPYSREQNKTPCMEICDVVRALTVAIEAID